MRVLCLLALGFFITLASCQTAAPLPPLIYTYQGASAPSSLLDAISTAGANADSILGASGSDTATGLMGAFPSTATVENTNSPVAVTSVMAFSSGSPGEVRSTATRAPYTKVGTVDTSVAAATVGAAATSATSGAGRAEIPPRQALVGAAAVALAAVLGAGTLV
ncbi:hypothetical protein JCM3770_002737 [Rhodotorula araucariae]